MLGNDVIDGLYINRGGPSLGDYYRSLCIGGNRRDPGQNGGECRNDQYSITHKLLSFGSGGQKAMNISLNRTATPYSRKFIGFHEKSPEEACRGWPGMNIAPYIAFRTSIQHYTRLPFGTG